jgi:S1-C subfamily serine protease
MKPATRILLCFIALAGIGGIAHATEIKTYILSGTGFFVNPDGYLVTNNHVVQNCKRIMVEGAVPAREATLIATDKEHDLALLKTNAMNFDPVNFRDEERHPIAAGERAVIVGYPGSAFKTLEPITREATIVSPAGPQGEQKWLRLSDAVEQGNSGGPLFDTTGNAIGVVTAKAVIYTYEESDPNNGITSHEGIAISVPTVEAFLDHANIRYRTSLAENMLAAESITDHARRMIVNVRCEYRTEVIR